jgi:hypothetical protein
MRKPTEMSYNLRGKIASSLIPAKVAPGRDLDAFSNPQIVRRLPSNPTFDQFQSTSTHSRMQPESIMIPQRQPGRDHRVAHPCLGRLTQYHQ